MSLDIILRKPIKNDANYIYKLVQDTKVLDINSEYLYLLQSTHFADNCIVATVEEKIVGFVSGYIKPNHPDRLFIWQVGVESDYRGNDIAGKMLRGLLAYDNHYAISIIETTISPSNKASQRVFEKLAQELDATLDKSRFFEIEDFTYAHEEEILYTIKLNRTKEK